MATSKEFKEYIVEQFGSVLNITCRPMMGEYLLYADGILFGGIYDNRVLIKKVESNKVYQLKEEIPYKGAKPMYLVENLEDSFYLKQLVMDTCKDLSGSKKGN